MKKFSILTVVGLMLAVASSASAATSTYFPLQFNNAVLGTAGGNLVLASPSTSPVTMTALPTGAVSAAGILPFEVVPSGANFPLATFSKPVPGTAQITLADPAQGTANFATGAVSFTASFEATISVTGIGSCTVTTGPQTFSTSGTSPYSAQAYPVVANTPGAGFLTGPGAITGSWSSLPAGTGSACSLLGTAVTGAGGLWIADDLTPPSVGVTSRPAKTTVKAGKKVTIAATVKNASGSVAASNVMVCVASPKALSLHGSKCQTVASLAGGASHAVRFSFKASAKAKGNEKVKVTATGATTPASSTVKITAAKKAKK